MNVQHDQISADVAHPAEVMVINGLHRGDFFDTVQHTRDQVPAERCRVCTLGALRVAVFGYPNQATGPDDMEDRYIAATGHVRAYFPDMHGMFTAHWSDRVGNTTEQAAADLRAAAAWRSGPAA